MIPILALAALSSLVVPQERPWTFMVYGAADNNADGPILDFLDGDSKRHLDDDAGMELDPVHRPSARNSRTMSKLAWRQLQRCTHLPTSQGFG